MAASNSTHIPNLPESHLSMERYDTLPPAIRQILRDAPYNFSISSVRLQRMSADGKELAEEMQRNIPDIIKSAASAAYGPDHPQAR